MKHLNEFYVEGNNGGDYIKLEALADNRLRIEVGHQCVRIVNHIIPIEWLTALIAGSISSKKDVREFLKHTEWSKEFTDTLNSRIENLD